MWYDSGSDLKWKYLYINHECETYLNMYYNELIMQSS